MSNLGVFSLIIISYIVLFFYLRKHGKSFADFLLRRRRGIIEVSHHHHYNQAESGLDGAPQPSFQQKGPYSPNTFNQSQGLRMPEPVHYPSNQRPQDPNPPAYSSSGV
ncbi:hypothetical protein B0J17DRAFT_258940 [Rhizoctonia solani]|nr:hypothetical protein B0J17DRAFT_258940 [Rhizoctonia solani]